MKKLFLLSIAAILLIGGGCAKNIPTTEIPNEKPIGGDKDINGCLTSAGYTWCEESNSCLRVWEEWCGDEALSLMDMFDKEFGVKFENEPTAEIVWRTENEEMKLTGDKFSAKDVLYENYNKIEDYLNTNFTGDKYNGAGGVTGGLSGYTLGYMACTLEYAFTGGEDSEEGPFVPDTSDMDVFLNCGLFNPNWLNDKPVELPTFSTTCKTSGGHWNECGNKCALAAQGQDGVACTLQCEQLCECGGIAGFSCPANHKCIMEAEGITDALGYCEVVFDEPIEEPMGEPINNTEVNNFEDCINAGNPAMESYPRQCRHGDNTYTEDIEIEGVELQM